ncbi:glycine--tRNA ligase subunit beta [Sulfuriflexus mobilis]|uniref:glycine--tRNA ligase subunit beta n=1 Tax=Sulfuriflexus mobilis TaxID=1811807 RepID=UPI000F849AF7|nr:glycine--tRNA ligase subunit beta [Sulfuriflexus mobilis]
MNNRDLLVEIGTEELPPKALLKLSAAFLAGVTSGLEEAGLAFITAKEYAAPRRLALLVEALEDRQADRQTQRRGPALTAAFGDDGCPTKAAEGFARSCGLGSVDELDRLETDKGAWLAHTVHENGKPAEALIPAIVQKALDDLPIPKRMRWGAGTAEFVRPVHWVVLLFGDKVIDAEVLGVKADRTTCGHRFHHPTAMTLFEAQAYAPLLESQGHVIADFASRREAVQAQVQEIAIQHGGKAVMDADLLDEVTAMVEWPIAVLGNFDERFLDVPAECLISSMKGHQKYFHVVDDKGALMPCFITVSNIDSKDIDQVRKGNERVIRPRLADAEFFWHQDKKHKLADRVANLNTVVFQKQLGTLSDKSARIAALAGSIAAQLGANAQQAARAAQLCKCDLLCEMVFEFPELQGIMGRYYATNDGEDPAVAQAIEDHYLPRFAGDRLPAGVIGQAVSIADKLDSLLGLFAIGQPPTGQKDPYALRRAALGVLRICMECDLDLDVRELIREALHNYQSLAPKLVVPETTLDEVFDFILGRLHVYYGNQDFAADEIDAVLSLRPGRLHELDQRLRAVAAFRKLPEAESLAAANTRITNILKKAADGSWPEQVDNSLLSEDSEKTLATVITSMRERLEPLLHKGDYTTALTELAALRGPVDAFFDNVMVMADDVAVRNNRLALLDGMRTLFLRIADLSRLQA